MRDEIHPLLKAHLPGLEILPTAGRFALPGKP